MRRLSSSISTINQIVIEGADVGDVEMTGKYDLIDTDSDGDSEECYELVDVANMAYKSSITIRMMSLCFPCLSHARLWSLYIELRSMIMRIKWFYLLFAANFQLFLV